MFDRLKNNLGDAIKKIVRSSGVDKDLIKALAKDVQKALLEAGVDVRLVSEISDRLQERAINETPPPGLSRKNHIIKILYDELAKMMGTESDFDFAPGVQNKLVLLGIQGSGKTTTAAKLARLLTGQGYKVGVIGADTYRPGALVQLRTMCERSNVEVYGEENSKDSPGIVGNGLRHFGRQQLDIIIIDTAGRHKEEKEMLEEMDRISGAAKPDLALLVIDGTIGMQCFRQAEAFHKVVPVGGIIVTKLDSSSKGGGALAASAATGAKIMYIGTGERIDDLEKFSPTRFVGRLLGMGDVKAVLDMAKRLESEGDEVRMKRLASGKMNMDDFFYQLEQIPRMGSLQGLVERMPGFSGLAKGDQVEKMEERISKWRYIIQSMNQDEKADPDLIKSSRIRRIARGSGWPEGDVKELLKNYARSKKMIKSYKGRQTRNMLKQMGLE